MCVCSEATRRLGTELFNKCYDYLREQRHASSSSGGGGGGGGSGGGDIDEGKLFKGLEKLNVSANDCFLVDQLLFLEDMNK